MADRLLRRGIVNARIYVVVVSRRSSRRSRSCPAFVEHEPRRHACRCFLVGGVFLTLPVAPADAMLTDVVVAPLRGRAAALRSIVRSLGGLTPLVIGALNGVYRPADRAR